jgi:rare lipoprotein A
MGRASHRVTSNAVFGAALGLVSLAACAHDPPGRPFVAPAVTQEQEPARGPPRDDLLHPAPGPRPAKPDQIGLATWYGKKFAGKPTSSGERFDPGAMTAAHRKLPFGTWVEVRRVETGRSVRVRINDRGPWGDDRRIIDLSQTAAEQLGIVPEGVARVEIYIVAGP